MAEERLSEARSRLPVEQLDAAELSRLTKAFAALVQTGVFASQADTASRLYKAAPSMLFLPWNRADLASFEAALRKFDPSVSLPFWDWTADRAIPDAFLGDEANPLIAGWIPEPDGDPSDRGESPRTDGVEHRRTVREPGASSGRLPTAQDITRVLAFDSFEAFASQLENLSNLVHLWVGGDMASRAAGPFDPLYWAHHAMVDRLWWMWQKRHPDSAVPQSLRHERLEPFSQTVNDVLDVTQLGYDYESTNEFSDQVMSGATNDQPSAQDMLGFRPYAAAFAEVIAAPATKPPLTIGIFAPWGMGKSTLLAEIVTQIDRGQGDRAPPKRGAEADPSRAPFIHTVQFNAWDFSADDAIWPALARTVINEMQKQVPGRRIRRVLALMRYNLGREWRANAARIVITMVVVAATAVIALFGLHFDPRSVGVGLTGLGLAGLLKVVADSASNPGTKWVADLLQPTSYGERTGSMNAIKRDLDFLVDQLTDEASLDRRVLVLIDDLDRCEPEKSVEVLQAVNRLLDYPCFIVCLGVDARVVTASIENHYKGLLGEAGASGFEYLDKIVQIPFRIPEPDEAAVAVYLEGLLPTKLLAEPQDDQASGPGSTGVTQPTGSTEDSATPRSLTYERIDTALEDEAPLGQRVPFRDDEVAAFKAVAPYVRSNPRHVKRLINVYRLVRTLAEWQARAPGYRADARLVLANPRATIQWIVATAQWPYSTSAMLTAYRSLVRSDQLDGLSAEKPLGCLLERATISRETQTRFDDEISVLAKLVEATDMDWQELRAIRKYTVNFNPAVEEQLRLEVLRSQFPKETTADSSNGSGEPSDVGAKKPG